jgi:hypothetical protein
MSPSPRPGNKHALSCPRTTHPKSVVSARGKQAVSAENRPCSTPPAKRLDGFGHVTDRPAITT